MKQNSNIKSDDILDKLLPFWYLSGINHYYDFMKHLDIGIMPIGSENIISNNYKIVNEQKWLLAKLKYGF